MTHNRGASMRKIMMKAMDDKGDWFDGRPRFNGVMDYALGNRALHDKVKDMTNDARNEQIRATEITLRELLLPTNQTGTGNAGAQSNVFPIVGRSDAKRSSRADNDRDELPRDDSPATEDGPF